MSIAAIIVAAGKGERAGTDRPKQFERVAGKTVVAHAWERLTRHPRIDRVIIVIAEGQQDQLADALCGAPHEWVTGGAERQDSVLRGLEAVTECQKVLIHDAARPFLSNAVIDRLIDALDTRCGAVPVLPVVDTLAAKGEVLGDVTDRARLVHVQTPQAFRTAEILAAHKSWTGPVATDDAQIARAAGHDVALVEGDSALFKLTYKADFDRAEAMMAHQWRTRTGLGFDVHRLEAGEELWLCGVKLEHSHGLSGHSDADVALHALVDALLGTIAAGDIGAHFPPSDPQWKGAASSRFVEHARDLVSAAGGVIDHVDLTLICEAPKIGPHRDRMQARVAELLQLSIGQVSIKATTTERLGMTGRGEGIAAQAIATIRIQETN